MYLIFLFSLEFIFRIILEIYDKRKTQTSDGIFGLFRLIPLINDIAPLKEYNSSLQENPFIVEHENAHKFFHHGILRNIFKIILLCFAVSFVLFLEFNFQKSLWECVLWLHFGTIPFKLLFHIYCWNQEYEADTYAFKKIGKKQSKAALKNLIRHEFPHTKIFALFYREHPPATLRYKNLEM